MKCEDKIKYPTEEHAYRMVKINHRRGLIHIRHYKCECGNYHLTHKQNAADYIRSGRPGN